MPLALIIIAALLFVTAIKGNYQAVGQQFNQTFFGGGATTNSSGQTTTQSGFLVWFGSILGLAIVFRIINAPKAGELFIGLLLLVYFLQNSSVLTSIEQGIQGIGAAQSSGSVSSSASGSAQASPSSSTTTTGTTTPQTSNNPYGALVNPFGTTP